MYTFIIGMRCKNCASMYDAKLQLTKPNPTHLYSLGVKKCSSASFLFQVSIQM